MTTIVRRFAKDPRVLFWSMFNEPHNDPFSLSLRDAAFKWCKAINPTQPLTSLWSTQNNDTEIVNIHQYDDNFASWTAQALSGLPHGMGSVVTEAGCRWYQGASFGAAFGTRCLARNGHGAGNIRVPGRQPHVAATRHTSP